MIEEFSLTRVVTFLSGLLVILLALGTVFDWIEWFIDTVIGWIFSPAFPDALAVAATFAGLACVLLVIVLTAVWVVVKLAWNRLPAILFGIGSIALWLFLVIIPWNEAVLQPIGGVCLLLILGTILILLIGTVEDHLRLRQKRHKKCRACGARMSTHATVCRHCAYRDPHKVCPDCAEDVKPLATVCRYCGYRFAETESPGRSSS
jgi:ribosomal protein L40E